jgi:hypothetical protein
MAFVFSGDIQSKTKDNLSFQSYQLVEHLQVHEFNHNDADMYISISDRQHDYFSLTILMLKAL